MTILKINTASSATLQLSGLVILGLGNIIGHQDVFTLISKCLLCIHSGIDRLGYVGCRWHWHMSLLRDLTVHGSRCHSHSWSVHFVLQLH